MITTITTIIYVLKIIIFITYYYDEYRRRRRKLLINDELIIVEDIGDVEIQSSRVVKHHQFCPTFTALVGTAPLASATSGLTAVAPVATLRAQHVRVIIYIERHLHHVADIAIAEHGGVICNIANGYSSASIVASTVF